MAEHAEENITPTFHLRGIMAHRFRNGFIDRLVESRDLFRDGRPLGSIRPQTQNGCAQGTVLRDQVRDAVTAVGAMQCVCRRSRSRVTGRYCGAAFGFLDFLRARLRRAKVRHDGLNDLRQVVTQRDGVEVRADVYGLREFNRVRDDRIRMALDEIRQVAVHSVRSLQKSDAC